MTVRNHLTTIARKLGTRGRLGVTAYFYKRQLRAAEEQRDNALSRLEQSSYSTTGKLTRREREVVNHLITGDRYDTIARAFDISVETVKHHIFNISKRVGIKEGRAEVAAFLYKHRLKELNDQRDAALTEAHILTQSRK